MILVMASAPLDTCTKCRHRGADPLSGLRANAFDEIIH